MLISLKKSEYVINIADKIKQKGVDSTCIISSLITTGGTII
jgi:hypothetical protein